MNHAILLVGVFIPWWTAWSNL